jgi:hypothetical protein
MDKRAGAIGPREARMTLEGTRPFSMSQCLRCSGCRFVAGRHEQVYLRCERTSQRYPRQPQLRCEAFQGLERAMLTLHADSQGEPHPLIWRLPSLKAPFHVCLGAPLDLTSPPLSEALSSSLEPTLAPPSALLLEPLEREGERLTRARLLWTSTPQRGLCLGWSERLLALPLGCPITLTPHPTSLS